MKETQKTKSKIPWEYTIKGRIPSKKNQRRFVNKGGRMISIPSKNHNKFEKRVLEDIRYIDKVVPSNPFKSFEVILDFYAPDKRKADLTNKAETIMDILVKAEIIEDDSWFHCTNINLCMCGVDRENPKVNIYILNIEK